MCFGLIKLLFLTKFIIGIPITINFNNITPTIIWRNSTPNFRHTERIKESMTTFKSTSEYDFDPENSTIPLLHSWECGTDEFTKYISASAIERDCPIIKSIFINF